MKRRQHSQKSVSLMKGDLRRRKLSGRFGCCPQSEALPRAGYTGIVVPNIGLQICSFPLRQLIDETGRPRLKYWSRDLYRNGSRNRGPARNKRLAFRIQISQNLKIAKISKGWQKGPDLAYSALPITGRSQGILGASHMAFCINQAAVDVEEAICRLQQQEMLPDVPSIARMHSVIIVAHSCQ